MNAPPPLVHLVIEARGHGLSGAPLDDLGRSLARLAAALPSLGAVSGPRVVTFHDELMDRLLRGDGSREALRILSGFAADDRLAGWTPLLRGDLACHAPLPPPLDSAAAAGVPPGEGRVLLLLAGYGGRWDVLRGTAMMAAAPAGESPGLADFLVTANLPDPDFLVVAGGDRTIPDLLTYQGSYAEMLFLETPWPNLGNEAFEQSLAGYRTRTRRFGKL